MEEGASTWTRWSILRYLAFICLAALLFELVLLSQQPTLECPELIYCQNITPCPPQEECSKCKKEEPCPKCPKIESKDPVICPKSECPIPETCTGNFFPNVLSYNESLACKTKTFIFTSYKIPISDRPDGLKHFDSLNLKNYKFVYFDDEDGIRFMKLHFPNLFQYYEMIPKELPAIRSDFFRLLLLKHYGGIWTDYDNEYTKFDEEFLDSNPNILVRSFFKRIAGKDAGETVYTALMKFEKNLPFLHDLILTSAKNLKEDTWRDCMDIAGPIFIHSMIMKHFGIPENTTGRGIPIEESQIIFNPLFSIRFCEEKWDASTRDGTRAHCTGPDGKSIVFARAPSKPHGNYNEVKLCQGRRYIPKNLRQ